MASSIQPFLDDATERMQKSVDHFLAETRGIRTGRASAGLVENIRVDYYGTKTLLNQLATITVPDPRSLLVKPYDQSCLKDVERAILAADLGLNPSIEGKALRISIPPLSEEQRKKLVGRVKALAEEARVSMRNVRRDVLKDVELAHRERERDPAITDDDLQRAKERIQEILKDFEKKIGEILDAKSKEILEG